MNGSVIFHCERASTIESRLEGVIRNSHVSKSSSAYSRLSVAIEGKELPPRTVIHEKVSNTVELPFQDFGDLWHFSVLSTRANAKVPGRQSQLTQYYRSINEPHLFVVVDINIYADPLQKDAEDGTLWLPFSTHDLLNAFMALPSNSHVEMMGGEDEWKHVLGFQWGYTHAFELRVPLSSNPTLPPMQYPHATLNEVILEFFQGYLGKIAPQFTAPNWGGLVKLWVGGFITAITKAQNIVDDVAYRKGTEVDLSSFAKQLWRVSPLGKLISFLETTPPDLAISDKEVRWRERWEVEVKKGIWQPL